MKSLDQLFTPQDLAAYLDIPVTTLYAWRYRGLGPAGFRVGRHVRYRLTDIEEWISAQLEHTGSISGPSDQAGRVSGRAAERGERGS